jgi:hypothetical protein
MSESNQYEYVTATIHNGCDLSWRYKIPGSDVHGRDAFDEPVEKWNDVDIIALTTSYLGVGNPGCIEVVWD